MGRKRQLTPSTTGSRVHTTRYRPLNPLLSHTVPDSRRRSSSVRCITAQLRPAHKAMGDERFATGTDSSCGWSSARERGSRVRARSLSFFSWAVFAEIITTLKLLNCFRSSNFYMQRQRCSMSHHVQPSMVQRLAPIIPSRVIMAPLYVFLFLVLAFRGRCARPSKFGTKVCVAFCHSLRSILVISGHSHQSCWRVLSPFLSADRGLVLSQKAQGEKHDILTSMVAATIHVYVKFSLCRLYSVLVDTCTQCPLLNCDSHW